jgi:hypothetical protein
MDPDLVRQQEEAEREAMGLAARKPGTPAGAAIAALQAIAASATLDSMPMLSKDAGVAPAPALAPGPRRSAGRPLFWYFSEFLSFGLAGTMLGGGLGVAAANYMQLPIEAAKLAIFGSAGFFALACAFASFFTGRNAQPRASSGT